MKRNDDSAEDQDRGLQKEDDNEYEEEVEEVEEVEEAVDAVVPMKRGFTTAASLASNSNKTQRRLSINKSTRNTPLSKMSPMSPMGGSSSFVLASSLSLNEEAGNQLVDSVGKDLVQGAGKRVRCLPACIVGLGFYSTWKAVEGSSITFTREPDNEYDPNAIAAFMDGEQFGFLSRALASSLFEYIDRGMIKLQPLILSSTQVAALDPCPQRGVFLVELRVELSIGAELPDNAIPALTAITSDGPDPDELLPRPCELPVLGKGKLDCR